MFQQIAQVAQSYPFNVEALAQSSWLLIAFPLAGALICGVFGRMLGRQNTQAVACVAVLGSLALSALLYWAVNDPHTAWTTAFEARPIRYAIGHDYGTWFQVGGFKVNFGIRVDGLNAVLLLVITG